MPHQPRIFVPGLSHHVYRRGHNHCAIVRDDDDRRSFLRLIRNSATTNDTLVHGYSLMDTHYHMIVTPGHEGALSEMMKAIGEQYVDYFNRKYDRLGTLWAGRFRSPAIWDERYWLTCLRYVELNAVAAGMVIAPEDYRWCSYGVHACGEPSEWLTSHSLYLALGSTPEERQSAYREFCGMPLSEHQLVMPPLPRSVSDPGQTAVGLTRA
jgi:REP-associated tyrosine transposase